MKVRGSEEGGAIAPILDAKNVGPSPLIPRPEATDDAWEPELVMAPIHALASKSSRHEEIKRLLTTNDASYMHAFVAGEAELDDLLQTAKGRAGIEYYATTGRRIMGQLVMLNHSPKIYGIKDERGTHEFDWATARATGDLMRLSIRARGARSPQVDPAPGNRTISEPILVRTSTPVLKASQEEAVMMKLMQTFHEAGYIFGHPALYAHYADRPEEVRALIARWYETAAVPLLEKNANMKSTHLVLLLDPGIACRPDTFAAFYAEHVATNPNTSAAEIRAAFAAKLDENGPMELFRGVSLPHGDEGKRIVERLKQDGCRAGLFRAHSRRPNLDASCLRPFFDATLNQRAGRAQPNGIMDNIRAHVAGETDRSIFSSTSKYIEVTHIAGWNLMFQKHELGQFHLMRLEVPHIDVVRFEGIYHEGADVWREHDPVYWDGKNFRIDYTHPDFEMFVTGAPRVVDVYPYDSPPPRYHRLDRNP